MSTRRLLKALKTSAAKCGPKERALAMATSWNFGNEVVVRGGPFICIEACQLASFELLVKKATSHLLALRVRLWHRIHYSFLYGCFSDFYVGVTAEE